jgi:hypothetical protein
MLTFINSLASVIAGMEENYDGPPQSKNNPLILPKMPECVYFNTHFMGRNVVLTKFRLVIIIICIIRGGVI